MLHVLRDRASLTSSDLGIGTVPYNFAADAHVAFAAWLASDPRIIRSRSSMSGTIAPGSTGAADLAQVAHYIYLANGINAAELVEQLAATGNIRLLHADNAVFNAPNATAAQIAISGLHSAQREPLLALRSLLLHGSGMQKMPISHLDSLIAQGGPIAASPTAAYAAAVYQRIFFRVSYTAPATGGNPPVGVLDNWEQLILHPGMPATFTGRILGLNPPSADYWRFHFLHPTATVVDEGPSLISDAILMALLCHGEKLSDPGRLKSSSIEANQLDREDQQKSTAELLAAHAVAMGLLRHIVTDCFFEMLLQQPWLRPIFMAALDRVSLVDRFSRATADTAPYRFCGGPLCELWARHRPISATISAIMDRPHPIHAVPADLWEDLMQYAYPATPSAAGQSAYAVVQATGLKSPSRRGTNARAFRILESQLVSPLGVTPNPQYLDSFIENRLALADILSGASETRVAQALKFILSSLGWTSAPVATRSLPASLFEAPVLTDGSYASAPVDIVDLRAGRTMVAADASSVTTIVTPSSNILKTAGYAIGCPVGQEPALADLGMPSAEEPRDYAALYATPSAPVDFDADARVVPNTNDEWARQLSYTVGEFNLQVVQNYEKWVHLFEIVNGTPVPRYPLAITSSRIARLARSTIIVGLPSSTLTVGVEHFANPAASGGNVNEAITAQLIRSDALPGDHGTAWSDGVSVDDRHGFLTGVHNSAAPGPLGIVFVDATAPMNIRCIATWAPPVLVVDGRLPEGTRSDLLDNNKTLTARY